MISEVVQLMRTLIRNGCVNDGTPESGEEHRSVATLVDFFGVEGVLYEPRPGRQSLVYRIAGTDASAPTLALVPHLDVVPAGNGWSVDPFAAEVVGGFVYGRGAVDMLNVTAAMATAVKPYLTGELVPRGDLVFCAVADEESGGVLGAKPLVESRWDLVGADYLLTEVAYPALGTGDDRAIPVSVGEKGSYWSHLHTHGTPGHGSAPYGTDNALEKLVRAAHGVIEAHTPVAFPQNWPAFVAALGLDEALAGRLLGEDEVDDAIDEIAVIDPALARYVHAATHLTVSTTLLEAGTKINVIPEHAVGSLDVRSLPGMDRGFVDSYLRKAMGSASDEVDIVPLLDSDATISPLANPLWEAIADSVEMLDGHRRLIPTMMTVATDARFWRKRGTVAYGVGLFDDDMGFGEMLSLFHGRDERVSIASVERTADLYSEILRRFCGE